MYFLFYFNILLLCVTFSFGDDFIKKLSNTKWNCANENCSVPISTALAKHNYLADHMVKVSFKEKDLVNILGKPIDSKINEWLVSVGGKHGVAPKNVLKEQAVLISLSNLTPAKFDFSKLETAVKSKNAENLSTQIPTSIQEEEVTVEDEDASSEITDDKIVEQTEIVHNEGSILSNDSNSPLNLPSEASGDKLNESNELEAFASGQNTNSSSESNEGILANEGSNVTELNLPENVNISNSENLVPQELNEKQTQEEKSFYSSMSEEPLKKDTIPSESTSIEDSPSNSNSVPKIDDPSSVLQNETIPTSVNDHSSPSQSYQEVIQINHTETRIENDTLPFLQSGNNESQKSIHESESSDFQEPSISNPSPKPDEINGEKYTTETSPQISLNESYPDLSQISQEKPSEYGTENKESSLNLDNSNNTVTESLSENNPSLSSDRKNPDGTDEENDSQKSTDTVQLPQASEQPTQMFMPSFYKPNIKSYKTQEHAILENDVAKPTVDQSSETSTVSPTSYSVVTSEDEKPSTIAESLEYTEPTPVPVHTPEVPNTAAESLDKESNVPDIQQQSESNAESSDLLKQDTHEHPTEVAEESTTNWFSPISSIMNSFSEMFAKSDIGVDDAKTVHEFTNEKVITYEKDSPYSDLKNVCEKDNYCNQAEEIHKKEDSHYNDFITHSIPGLKEDNVSPSTLICLVVTSIAILLFSLGYYYLENLKHDTQLAARINSLSAELFFAQKELTTAEEKLTKANDDLQRLVSNSTSNEEELIKLKQELEDNEDVKQKLEQEIKRLEKEIESLVESSNEMHRMLSESISEDERIQALLANIDDLKGVVSSKLEEISSLTNQLDNEKQEVELLTIALKKSEEKKESLEEKLEKVVHEVETKALSATKEFEEKIISLERIIEENTLERVNFEKEIYDLKQKCETLSVEKELAEKSLKKAQGLGPGKALADWLETKEVRVELIATQKEVEKLKIELEEAKEHITNLEGREKELISEIETLNLNYETAEKNKIDALTKLQVLSNYFKEKETQLQEELGEKEALWLQKQSEDHTIYEQMRSLREENLSYKAQNEALKREILDQEASFKSQIANEEQKAQENWLQLRHTERRLKEAQMEAAHLRSRLTALETNSDSIEDKHNKSLDMVNGEGLGAASPPFMLYPPPDFIPPPPLISQSRPPPLGRLSSPPLTPPPPLSPYDMFPPPTASPPPPPLRVHKPQPREPPQKQKDSQSSTHSSESTEKPVRRGKR